MQNRLIIAMTFTALLLGCGLAHASNAPAKTKLRVVATLPDYAAFARTIGGDRVTVKSIVLPDQDAHFIRPKPSFVDLVRGADLLIATGLDLELWLPTVVDKSGNTRVRSGQPGFVAAAQGMQLLEKPKNMSRIEGGVHIYGNPHVTGSPVNMRVAARNIAIGLKKNDPAGAAVYDANCKKLIHEIDCRLFGEKLVKMLGGETLAAMARKGALVPFLQKNKFRGKPLVTLLGGWCKKMLPLHGMPLVTYHKNWVYFLRLFGMEEAGTIEPKPGIPPSPRHVAELMSMMRKRKIKVVLAANYFDEQKIRTVASRVGARAVIVPVYSPGKAGAAEYFKQIDSWTGKLLAAAGRE